MMQRGQVSFWHAALGPAPRRAPLQGDDRADVAIIGAGYTGLWAAYYIAQARPDWRIVVLERAFAGFGASGRNGGWLTGGFAWSQERYAATHGRAATLAMVAALHDTVDEVISVAEAEGIAADIRRTEEVTVALNPAQMQRMQAEHAHRTHWGEGARIGLLDAAELRARLQIPGALGAMVTRGVARVQPARLLRGLAQAVERRGVTIHEGTEVIALAPGSVTTRQGSLRAPIILRATEGFSAQMPGHRRDWLPLNSAQIVTNPLPPEVWAQIGWDRFEIVGDFNHLYSYCQRTEDGRIAVGGRGVPYRFGSGVDHDGEPDPATIARLTAPLARHFPHALPHGIAHAWCGVLGVPRDWCATAGFDPGTGIGWAGGSVGVGVSTSNLAGRVLADLVQGRQTALTALPMVNRRVRRWEPEPLRWLGVRGMYALLAAADRREARPGAAPSRLARWGHALAGR